MNSEETLDKEQSAGAEQEAGETATELAEAQEVVEVGETKRTLGIERWVQLGFVVAGLLLVWLYSHVISGIWYFFADPNESVVAVLAVAAGLVTAGILYNTSTVYALTHDTVDELSKVTWPTRKETSSSTVVVVVTSVVAALVLFLFDSIWSAVTDLVYKV